MTTPDGDESSTLEIHLRDYLSGEAKVAAESLEELAQDAKRAARALLLLHKNADKATNSLIKLTAATRAYNAAQKDFIGNLDKQNASFARQQKMMPGVLRNQNRLASGTQLLSKRTDKNNRSLITSIGLLGKLAIVAKIAAVAVLALGAAYLLVGAGAYAGVLLQGLLQIIGALSSLIALAALAPTALLSLGGAIAVLAVGFRGVGEGIGAAFLDDGTEFEEAIAKLPKHVRAFVREFREFVPLLRKIKTDTQNALFKPLAKELPYFLDAVLPRIHAGMKTLAADFGELFADLMKFARSHRGRGLIENIFGSAKTVVDNAKMWMVPFLRSIALMVDMTMPYWERLNRNITDMFLNLSRWIEDISTNGKLHLWLDKAFYMSSQLWKVLKLTAGILKDIVDAAGGASFAPLLGFLGVIRAFTESQEGQEAMASFFQLMRDVVAALTPFLVELVDVLAALFQVIAPILVELLPGFVAFVEALADGFRELAPYAGPFGKALGDIFVALAPLLPVLGQLIGYLAMFLGLILQGVGAFLAPFIAAFSELAEHLFPLFADLLMTAMPMIVGLFDMWADVFDDLMPLIRAFTELFINEFKANMPQWRMLLSQVVVFLQQLVMLMSENLITIIEDLLTMMPTLIPLFMELWMASLELLPALLPLLIDLVQLGMQLYDAFAPLIPVILTIMVIGIKFGIVMVRHLTSIIETIEKAWDAFSNFGSVVQGVMSTMYGVLVQPFVDAYNTIKGILDNLSFDIGGIADALGGIGGIASGLGSILSNPFKAEGGPVLAGRQYIVGEVGTELFVPASGKPEFIGVHGQESRTFEQPGFVIPNYMLEILQGVESGMAKQLEDIGSPQSSSSRELAAVAAALEAVGGDTYNVDVTVNGNVDDEVDIERAVIKALKKVERDKKERS